MKVLITGGSGLIGRAITSQLKDLQYDVIRLSRSIGKDTFVWEPKKGVIPQEALIETDIIIHLAGENVGSGRWTTKRKKEILESRIDGTRTIVQALQNQPNKVKFVLFASAIGYYGSQYTSIVVDESSSSGNDYLAQVTQAWENEMHKLKNIPFTIVRIGVVLAKNGGALSKLALPIRFGLGSKIGTGDQSISWIHIDDVVSLFVRLILMSEKPKVINAVTPHPVSQWEFTKALAKVLDKPLFMPPLPVWVLQCILGEMHILATKGVHAVPTVALNLKFQYKYTDLEQALRQTL